MPSEVTCHPLTSVLPVPKQQLPVSFAFNLIYLPLMLAMCDMVWNIPLASWDQLSCCVFSQVLVPSSLLAHGVL